MKRDESPAVRLEGVRRSFGAKTVLSGVTGTIPRGRVVGLLGRNGEGKSTLFQLMLDLLAADAGTIEVLGRRPDGSGDIRRHVGYIPERPAFHSLMSLGEVLEFRSRFFPSWKNTRAMALSGQLGLDLATPVRGASKGTLGKLAWVCAAAHEPELFFLDEPTSGLDTLVRDDILHHLVAELQKEGRTIVVANHRMDELAGILDEVWVLADGEIAARHEVDRLRSEACRITGRVKDDAPAARVWPVPPLRAEGPLVEWVVLDKAVEERILGSGLLERTERKSMPVHESLKHLLAVGRDAIASRHAGKEVFPAGGNHA
ncbi:MAG: ABC transporter ATP-binding protein [Elusimicrobia bacterium]|nr:ABC transporter ATP-binding protein [Elusimicrobiota bacterium]